MTSVTDRLKTQTASAADALKAERANAPAEYAALLDPDRTPQPGDTDKLRQVMNVLGIDMPTLERHAQARRDALAANDMEQQRQEADAEHQRIVKRIAEADEAFSKIEREHRDNRASLVMASTAAYQKRDRIQREAAAVKMLRKRYPLAFGEDHPDRSDVEVAQQS